MGRYYRTADPRFVQDMIYKPDFNLMKMAANAKDKEYEDNVKILKFLDTLPIETAPFDLDYFKEIQDRYNKPVEEVVNMYKEDPMNPEAQKMIYQLRDRFKKDMNSGDLNKILRSSAQYKKYKDELKKLSPEDQKLYSKYEKDYLDNIGSSKKDVFSYGKILPQMSIINHFLKSDFAKKVQPKLLQDFEKSFRSGNMQMLVQKYTKKSLKNLNDAFKIYLNEDPTVKEYMDVRNSLGEKYYSEDGSFAFSDPNSPLYELDKKLNPFAIDEEKHMYSMRAIPKGTRVTVNNGANQNNTDYTPSHNMELALSHPRYKKVFANNNLQFSSYLSDVGGYTVAVMRSLANSLYQNDSKKKLKLSALSKNILYDVGNLNRYINQIKTKGIESVSLDDLNDAYLKVLGDLKQVDKEAIGNNKDEYSIQLKNSIRDAMNLYGREYNFTLGQSDYFGNKTKKQSEKKKSVKWTSGIAGSVKGSISLNIGGKQVSLEGTFNNKLSSGKIISIRTPEGEEKRYMILKTDVDNTGVLTPRAAPTANTIYMTSPTGNKYKFIKGKDAYVFPITAKVIEIVKDEKGKDMGIDMNGNRMNINTLLFNEIKNNNKIKPLEIRGIFASKDIG